MRSSLDKLTAKEKELLADFYKSSTYEALKKLIELEREELAKDAILAWQNDPKFIAYLAGGADKLKGLCVLLKDNNKKSKKTDS
jgi:hypothetical protein